MGLNPVAEERPPQKYSLHETLMACGQACASGRFFCYGHYQANMYKNLSSEPTLLAFGVLVGLAQQLCFSSSNSPISSTH